MSTFSTLEDKSSELIQFVEMDQIQLEHLKSGLGKIKSGISYDEIIHQLEKETRHLNIFLHLIYLLADTNLKPEEFLDEVFNFYNSIHEKAKIDKPTFIDNFSDIFLSDNPVIIAVKADYLKLNYLNTFSNIKIFTDLRPVFSIISPENLMGSIIIHQLKMSYITDDDEKEIYITADQSDLQKIQEAIERALLKQQALEKSSNISKIL